MQPTSPCDRVRSGWLDALIDVDRPVPLAADAREHVAGCAACQRLIRTWPLAARALAELPRQRAPRELDSAVVAAGHAGARTDRAVRALEQLARLHPPEELAEALESPAGESRSSAQLTRASAPRVLDRLVQEELTDPGKARARRHVGGLARLFAPGELAGRVAAQIRYDRQHAAVSRAQRTLTQRRLRGVLGLAGALALATLALSLPFSFWGERSVEKTRPFRIERASSLGAMSPITRGMLDQAFSGQTRPQRS